MTQFTEDRNDEGLQRVGITTEEAMLWINQHTGTGYEAREMAEKFLKDQEQAQKAHYRDVSRLGGLKAYNRFTLENYDNKGAVEMCAGFPGKNLYLWGAAGTGKTHLATALVREHKDAIVVRPQHIYRACRGLKSGEEEQAAVDKFVYVPFLVIDDLGIYETSFGYSVLIEIIDGRDMQCQKGMIITCNLSLDSLAEKLKDDRVTSRIAGLCQVLEIKGRDRRLDSH